MVTARRQYRNVYTDDVALHSYMPCFRLIIARFQCGFRAQVTANPGNTTKISVRLRRQYVFPLH